MSKKKNVFFIGLDDFNRRKLEALPEAAEWDFHAALAFSEMRGVERFDIGDLIERASQRISTFSGSVDGIAS